MTFLSHCSLCTLASLAEPLLFLFLLLLLRLLFHDLLDHPLQHGEVVPAFVVYIFSEIGLYVGYSSLDLLGINAAKLVLFLCQLY
jgi:hypothetical protein